MAQTAFREVTEHMMEISKASDHSIQKKIQSLLNDNNIDNNLKNKIMSVFNPILPVYLDRRFSRGGGGFPPPPWSQLL